MEREASGGAYYIDMERRDLHTEASEGYELVDSGENMKLERYGSILVARPETQALWPKAHPERWNETSADFSWSENKGSWHTRNDMPESWTVPLSNGSFVARLTSFKHVGIFPEQTPNWEWTEERIKALPEGASVLNLFGYTGIASVLAAKAGAKVTHVDASKQAIGWVKENAKASGLPDDAIRYLLDDALAFAKREVRRGSKYDGIILDPPAFGRGAKGEVWHIEEQLPELLAALRELMSETKGAFFLMSGYAAGYAPDSFRQLVEGVFQNTGGEYGELQIRETGDTRVVPAGIYARFSR